MLAGVRVIPSVDEYRKLMGRGTFSPWGKALELLDARPECRTGYYLEMNAIGTHDGLRSLWVEEFERRGLKL